MGSRTPTVALPTSCLTNNQDKMKVIVALGVGVPEHIQDVESTTTIAEVKESVSEAQGLPINDFKLYLLANELKDHHTIGDISFDEAEEINIRGDMNPRSGVFTRNLGKKKWVIHGSEKKFKVGELDKDDGVHISSTKFGIATTVAEENGNRKKYKADIFKASKNWFSVEAVQVEITDEGEIIEKTNGVTKKLTRTKTVEFDEKNKMSDEDEDSDDLLGLMKMLKGVSEMIKTIGTNI